MKARPRRAENRVAEILSDFFVANGLSPIERIPVLGRTGPDLTINEANLIVDVKSRQSCPKGIFRAVEETGKARRPELAAFRLETLQESLVESQGVYVPMKTSKMVFDWLGHMDDWTQENTNAGISAIVTHRPQLPYGNSVLVVRLSDVGLLRKRIKEPQVIGAGDAFLTLSDTEDAITVHSKTGETRIELSHNHIAQLKDWAQRRF